MVTNMISQLQESFPLRRAAGSFEISFKTWLRGAKAVRLPLYSLDELSNFHIDIFSELVQHPGRFAEVVLCGNFISVYKINRTLHGRLEIRNFSSSVEKIFHSFAALTREIFFNTRREISRGHVISSIYSTNTFWSPFLHISVLLFCSPLWFLAREAELQFQLWCDKGGVETPRTNGHRERINKSKKFSLKTRVPNVPVEHRS